MSNDPLANINRDEAKMRLDAARAAYVAAEEVATAAIAAADEAGEPRFAGITNRQVHVAEREAIDALLDAKDEYEVALQTWRAILYRDWV